MERGRKEGEGPDIKYFDSQTSSKFNNFHHQTQGTQRVKRRGQVLPAECCLWPCYLNLPISLVIRKRSLHACMLM